MRATSLSPGALFSRAFSVALAAAFSATLVAACGPVVVVGGGGGGDGESGDIVSEGPGATSGDEETGLSGAGESDFELACGGASGSCSSVEYPEGETCGECFCRCCNIPDLMAECQGEPACMEYVECLITCDGDETCLDGCSLPCPTGSEAACYLEDCRNWVCAHTCGEYP